MSEFYDTSSQLDLCSGASTGREFYLHSPAASGDQPAVEPALDCADPSQVSQQLRIASYYSVKSAVDRLTTALLMLVALPLMLLIGSAIVAFDGLPVFYRQTRVGKNGRKYRMWKFRTMCRDAERKTGAVWSTDSDPRVTSLGRWLRCSHLDELPQFFNVLIGDMNLIGPRPERPEFVNELARQLPNYSQRLKARPGITGLAQLRLGYDQSVADVQRKLSLDLEYLKTASFLVDAKIVISTFPYITTRLLGKWMRAPASSHDHASERQAEMPEPNVRRPDSARPINQGPHLFPNVGAGDGANVLPHASENR